MSDVFAIADKHGRRIRLSHRAWAHISKRHPVMTSHLEEIKETLKKPDALRRSGVDPDVWHYYRYQKSRPSPARYLLVLVKYLKNDGFIISAYFVKHT